MEKKEDNKNFYFKPSLPLKQIEAVSVIKCLNASISTKSISYVQKSNKCVLRLSELFSDLKCIVHFTSLATFCPANMFTRSMLDTTDKDAKFEVHFLVFVAT